MQYPQLFAAAALAAFLSGCGGGGEGGGKHDAPSGAANTPPVAVADAPQATSVNTAVALDGSKSSDANGDLLSYAWTLTSRPAGSNATLASATSAKASFTPDVPGAYAVTLVVNDGRPNGTHASAVSITASAVNVAGPGQFLQARALKTVTPGDIASALARAGDAAFLATPKYAVQAYRVTYTTIDGDGRQVAASGLVAIPQKPANALSPVLSYQHATITAQQDAPSALDDLGDPPVVLASLGYIVVASDYVGYGVSAGTPHPYLISAPSAAAVVDLLTAAQAWRQTLNVQDNQQLFLTGYSEGGYVTVAAHRALEAGASAYRNQLVRVIAGAGPYDVNASFDQLLGIIRQEYPVLGQVLNPGLLRYLGDTDRRHARELLLALLVGGDAGTFAPTVFDYYLNDNRAAIEGASSVYDWAPQAPLDLFHGRDDRTVPYVSSTNTLQAMRARGAGNRVTLTDCVAQPAGHSQCVLPYWRFVLDRFGRDARNL